MADRYLLESGAPDGYQLEDGSGVLLLEQQPFDPANFPWPQPVVPRAPTPRATAALLTTACFFVALPALGSPGSLGWQPEYPDFARGKKPLPILGGEARTHLEREPTTDWLPVFPDFARGPTRPQNAGGQATPPVSFAPASVALDWLPDFPDFTRSRRLVGEGQFEWTNVEYEPTTDWRPSFPDFARAAKRPVNVGGPSWTHLEREPNLDWKPEYPDFARGKKPLPILGGEARTHLEREPNLDWKPEFPDFARGKKPLVPQGFSVFPIQEREPQLDWLPTYPDFLLRPRHPVFGQTLWANAERTLATDWLPTYPDFTRASKRPVNEGQSVKPVGTPTVVVVTDTSWLPTYPDFARGQRRVLTSEASPLVQPLVPALSWLAVYPDAPWLMRTGSSTRRHRLIAEQWFTPVFPVAPPLDGWHPTYPDFFRPAARPFPPAEAAPDSPRPPLVTEWSPTFPDFVRALQAAVRTGGAGSFVGTDFHPVLAWSPVYPDFARGPRYPLNVGGVRLVLTEQGPLYVFKVCGTIVEVSALTGKIRSANVEGLLPVSYVTGKLLNTDFEGLVRTSFLTVVLDEGHTC